ncbi:MAG: nucleotidyltransferase family protein [archaeon]
MAYTEIKERNRKKYYYRVRSIREGKKVSKKRIYLGKDLKLKELKELEKNADKKINPEKEIKKKEIKKLIPKIVKILKKYKIKKAGIFGSYVRGEQKKNSDIDIIVEYPKGMGFGFFGIEFELEKKLGKKVDLVTYKYLSPYIRDRVLSQEVRII